MNPLEHYRSTRLTHGKWLSFFSMLPDITQVLRLIPPLREYSLIMHNTETAVNRMSRLGLGTAWKLHWEQDMKTHDFSYTDKDRVPPGSVMLLSGGLDSFCQWRLLGQPKAVYFAIGHRAESREIDAVERIREKFGGDIIIDRSLQLGQTELDTGYIPYRNLLFIILASQYSKDIVLSQIAEWAPDKNLQFYRMLEIVLRKAGRGKYQGILQHVRVHAPFHHLTKTQLVRRYLGKFPAEDLNYTVSCYSDQNLPCGVCSACFPRYVAMSNNGILEQYSRTPQFVPVSWKDFHWIQLPVYYKRWRELQQFQKVTGKTIDKLLDM